MKVNYHLLLSILFFAFLSHFSVAQDSTYPESQSKVIVEKEVLKENTKLNQISTSVSQEEHFDFWVGEWSASWSEGEGKIGKGTNSITKVLDGTGIQEDFKIHEGQSAGFKGMSISTLTSQKKWKQTWMDSSGGYYDFTGMIENGDPVFSTDLMTKEDKQIIQKMVFKDITKDAFTWDWLGTQDGGKTWNLLWRINYERRK